MWATGAVSGFFAVPYTIVLYPIIFFFLGRMWSVAHRHGYVTTADIVQGRYGTRSLSLAVAVTGILATMPYIALQLVGIQAVLEVVGHRRHERARPATCPLLIAFAVLAAYTYSSGLRAPAMIAFVKDILIYIVIAVAVIYLPLKFGGWRGIFDAAQAKMAAPSAANPTVPTGVFIPGPAAALGVRVAGPRLGPGPVHVPALRHRDPELEGPQHRPPERRHPAGVLAAARAAGPARLRRDQGRHQADRAGRHSRTRSWSSRSSSRTTSRTGSPASPSGRSPSVPWCRRRSCRSPRRTCSPATSTRPT